MSMSPLNLSLSRLQKLATAREFGDSSTLSFHTYGKTKTFTVIPEGEGQDVSASALEKKRIRAAVYDSLLAPEPNGANSDLHKSASKQKNSFRSQLLGTGNECETLTLGDVRMILKSLTKKSLYQKPVLPSKPGVRTGNPKQKPVLPTKPGVRTGNTYQKPVLPTKPGVRTGNPKQNPVSSSKSGVKQPVKSGGKSITQRKITGGTIPTATPKAERSMGKGPNEGPRNLMFRNKIRQQAEGGKNIGNGSRTSLNARKITVKKPGKPLSKPIQKGEFEKRRQALTGGLGGNFFSQLKSGGATRPKSVVKENAPSNGKSMYDEIMEREIVVQAKNKPKRKAFIIKDESKDESKK